MLAAAVVVVIAACLWLEILSCLSVYMRKPILRQGMLRPEWAPVCSGIKVEERVRANADWLFKCVGSAHAVLTNPTARAELDADLAAREGRASYRSTAAGYNMRPGGAHYGNRYVHVFCYCQGCQVQLVNAWIFLFREHQMGTGCIQHYPLAGAGALALACMHTPGGLHVGLTICSETGHDPDHAGRGAHAQTMRTTAMAGAQVREREGQLALVTAGTTMLPRKRAAAMTTPIIRAGSRIVLGCV